MQARRISKTSAYAITAAFAATPPWSGIAVCRLAPIWLVAAMAGEAMQATVGRGRVPGAFPEPAIEVADAGARMVAPSIAAMMAPHAIPRNSPAGATAGDRPRQARFAPACGVAV
jgi:hypothetical protein